MTTSSLPTTIRRTTLLSLLSLLLALAHCKAYVTLRPPSLSSTTTYSPSASSPTTSPSISSSSSPTITTPGSSTTKKTRRSNSNVVVSDAGLLIKNYRPLPPSDSEPLDVRSALLHISARKAIKSGKMDIARRFYSLFVYKWKGARNENAIAHTYFLWALLEQRAEDYNMARALFQEATTRYPTHARLLQAWALMESKCGKLEEARRLIAAAVENDKSLEPVLKWKLWGSPVASV